MGLRAWLKANPDFEREVRRRGKRALVYGIPAFLILAITGAASVALVLLTLAAVVLYVPPWSFFRYGHWVVPVGVVFLVSLYPFYEENLFEVPVFGGFPSLDTGVTMLIYIMMALGLNIVVGYAGLLDLGYVAFYAMGAYTAAWFASQHFHQVTIHAGSVGVDPKAAGIHISIWPVLVIAGIFTSFVGILIGFPTLRLRGDYLAIVTLGFGEIMPQVARNGDHLFGQNITNGPQGINPIDPPGFGGPIHNVTGLPADYLSYNATFLHHNISRADLFYWTALVLVLFTVFCCVRLRDSRLGRAWIAIREDETAAAAMGIPLMRTKTWAYAGGAFFGGVAGAYYASYKSGTFPDDFFFNISVFILCMVILGGMGNIWGVILGGGFLAYLNQEGLGNIGGWMNEHFSGESTSPNHWFTPPGWSHDVDIPLYSSGIFGLILVLVMLFKPEGLIPSSRRRAEFRGGVEDQPLYDVQHE